MRDANCNQNTDGSEQIKIVDKLSRSATREYCSYSYYLDYLDSNIRENIVGSITLDQQIGTTKPSVAPSTTDAALSETTKRTNAVENELARAQDTLPKAVVAYREMERTYTVHLLLVIIYDDYLALRDNLKSYMNSLSQTFEKANNAQDANQR